MDCWLNPNIAVDDDDLVFRVLKARRPDTVPTNPEPTEAGRVQRLLQPGRLARRNG